MTKEEFDKIYDRMDVIARRITFFKNVVYRAGENFRRDKTKGMQVPYHDDFADITPSVLNRLEWWSRSFEGDSESIAYAITEMDKLRNRLEWQTAMSQALAESQEKLAGEVKELQKKLGDRSEVNTSKLNDAFTEGTFVAGDVMRSQIKEAYRRGAEYMRTAAATHVAFGAHPSSLCGPLMRELAAEIREISITEEES